MFPIEFSADKVSRTAYKVFITRMYYDFKQGKHFFQFFSNNFLIIITIFKLTCSSEAMNVIDT